VRAAMVLAAAVGLCGGLRSPSWQEEATAVLRAVVADIARTVRPPWLARQTLLEGEYWSASGPPLDSAWMSSLEASNLIGGICDDATCPTQNGAFNFYVALPVRVGLSEYTVRAVRRTYYQYPTSIPCGDSTVTLTERLLDMESYEYAVARVDGQWAVTSVTMRYAGHARDSLVFATRARCRGIP
jgi:hypothetical protein